MSSAKAASEPQRIAVVGSPGAGKTTFSRELAEKTDLPIIHLDAYYHDRTKSYYHSEDKQAWLDKVQELIQPKQWIIDGNYSSTFPLRFREADLIIFLDYPRRISFRRTVTRIVKSRWKKRAEMPIGWKDTFDLEFLKFVWLYNSQYRQKVSSHVDEEMSRKVLVFRHPREAQRFLDSL